MYESANWIDIASSKVLLIHGRQVFQRTHIDLFPIEASQANFL